MQKRYVLVSDPLKLTIDNQWLACYEPEEIQWLSNGKACEFLTKHSINSEKDIPIDVFEFGPQETNRKKKVLFCDMDATTIENESLDEIAYRLPQAIQDKIAVMTLETMYGKVNLESSLRKRASYLKNLETTVILEAQKKIRPSKGIETVLRTMKERENAYCVLVSSGFTCISSYVRDQLQFNEDHANVLEEKNQQFTGQIIGRIVDGETKGKIVKETLNRLNINAHHALSLGDGSNDIYLLKESELGIAYKAKPILKETTKYQINHTSLVSALYAQGYRDDEIIFETP